MKKLNKHLIGDVKEFEDGYTGSESNSSIYIVIVLFLILMIGICSKGFSSDTIKKPNVKVTIDSNFKELPKEIPTTKIYTSIGYSYQPKVFDDSVSAKAYAIKYLNRIRECYVEDSISEVNSIYNIKKKCQW